MERERRCIWYGHWLYLNHVWQVLLGSLVFYHLVSDTAKGILWILEDRGFFQAIYKSHLFYGLDVA